MPINCKINLHSMFAAEYWLLARNRHQFYEGVENILRWTQLYMYTHSGRKHAVSVKNPVSKDGLESKYLAFPFVNFYFKINSDAY
jgi:hypothetical protein